MLLLSIGFSPCLYCLETRAQREAREAFEEYLADSPPAALHVGRFEDDGTGFAQLQGVWTYSTDDRIGYYLIGRCGENLFYYEDGASGRLFGLLVEGNAPTEAILSCMLSPAGETTTTFIVVLGTGMLILCPSSGSITSRFKPLGGASWHSPLEASRVGESAKLEVTNSSGNSGTSALGGSDHKSPSSSRTALSPLEWLVSVQKLTLLDERHAQQTARLAAIDKAASSFQPQDLIGKGETQKRVAVVCRPVDLSGTWNVRERTDGKFTLSLQQVADGSLGGELRYVDASKTGWSTKVSGYIEGRRISWTIFAWKGGVLHAEDSESTVTVISPCGRYLAGVGPIRDEPDRLRQHFSATLQLHQSRSTPAAARAASAVRDAKAAQARRDEQEQASPAIPQSRSWVRAASFTSLSFTAAQSSARASQSPDVAPAGRFSFSGRRQSQSLTAKPWTDEEEPPNTVFPRRFSFSGRKNQSLTSKPWTDEEESPNVDLLVPDRQKSRSPARKSQINETPALKVAKTPTSHRPGSKRAELSRRMRTVANLFRGGHGGNRGAPSETAACPAVDVRSSGNTSLLGAGSASSTSAIGTSPSQAARAVGQKWF